MEEKGGEGACERCLKGGLQALWTSGCGVEGRERACLRMWEVARRGRQEPRLDSLPGVGQLVLDQL